ncbi:uncharacterized protein LOC127005017 isoform X2 [Eriocheir sinensis]|uniref:uncharacterized protein LOC127005017 isoform X2 n=1 Tax=Eriocheir sinensis TaxID=95602 RepID=UPI0021C74699|nr:uncharacterized protein LOC127005017 isoform X2 [Eriocheir sinensis]
MVSLMVLLLLLVGSVMTAGYHPALLDVNGDMVVYDSGTEKPFCYPGANQPYKSIFTTPSAATARNIGRVLCRSLGYTHLVREYSIPANGIEGSRLLILCQGYERLIEQCTADKGAKNDCDEFLALDCGRCSETRQVEMGEKVEIISPEYPNYTDAAVCEWQLQASSRASFSVKFLNFRLPNTDNKGNCYVGYLEVSREVDGEVVEAMVKCGSAVPLPLTLEADTLILRFSSGTFYPRPYSSLRGFKAVVTVSPVAWSPRRLATMEVVSIAMGILLLLVITVVVFCILYRGRFRRRRWTRRRSRQRKLMQERLASQRPSYHEAVALTAMLAGMVTKNHDLHHDNGGTTTGTSGRGNSLPDTGRPRGARQWTRESCASRTSSVPLQMTSCPPLPPPPPSSVPPPARRYYNLHALDALQGSEEQPIYMEVDECSRTPFQAYLQLHELNPPRPDAMLRASLNSSVSTSGGPAVSPRLAAPTIRQSSSQPHLCPDQPSSPSPTLRNVFSNKLNVWPSNSSLSPSIKTLSSIGNTSKASMGSHINYFVQSRSVSSRGSSLSFNVENISPYSNRTLSRPLHLSLSPCGGTASKELSPCSPMEGTRTDGRRLPALHLDGTPLLTSSVLEKWGRGTSSNSCDSVFTVDGSDFRAQMRCVCGSSHSHGNRPLAAEQKQKLSKSCGDVSHISTIPKQLSMTELVRSEPILPRSQTTPRLVAPVLRRVSQMFFSSSPFSESLEAVDDAGADGALGVAVAAGSGEGEVRCDKRGTGTWRLKRNASRRAMSTSSGTFFPFSRLQNVCNNDGAKASSGGASKEANATRGAGSAP